MYFKIRKSENYTAITKWLIAAQTVENLNQAEAYNLPYKLISKQIKQIKCLLSQKYVNLLSLAENLCHIINK